MVSHGVYVLTMSCIHHIVRHKRGMFGVDGAALDSQKEMRIQRSVLLQVLFIQSYKSQP
jgi:hypothetical protein